jgi:hypothetical protein
MFNKALTKYNTPPAAASIDKLIDKLFSLADWVDDPSAAPIETRRALLPKIESLGKEIDRLRGEDGRVHYMQIIIRPSDGSFPGESTTGV